MFGGEASDEVDIEAFNEICRPPQNIPTMPARSRMYDAGALEDAVPFHVERNVFSINGKAINSMDIQTQNIDDCPESYNVRNGLFWCFFNASHKLNIFSRHLWKQSGVIIIIIQTALLMKIGRRPTHSMLMIYQDQVIKNVFIC